MNNYEYDGNGIDKKIPALSAEGLLFAIRVYITNCRSIEILFMRIVGSTINIEFYGIY